jgi:hypothetical protein
MAGRTIRLLAGPLCGDVIVCHSSTPAPSSTPGANADGTPLADAELSVEATVLALEVGEDDGERVVAAQTAVTAAAAASTVHNSSSSSSSSSATATSSSARLAAQGSR